MDPDAIRAVAADLPAEPGVYQFRSDDRTTYVGKAVDLSDRVRSYARPRSERIARMVAAADDVEVAVTDTESQALLLEANLIKRYQPQYNVRLKDDKSYPLVQITDHDSPRIDVTRDPDEGAAVFGPYTNKGRVDTVVKAIREVYGLRGCSDHKYAGRDRPCLDYEMGLCTAPCTGEIDPADYLADVESAKRFLGGELEVLVDPLQRKMAAAAAAENFERAANLRDRLEAVEAFHRGERAIVDAGTAAAREVTDVLGVATRGDEAVVARLHAEGGQLVDRERHTLAGPPRGEDASDDRAGVLAAFVPQFYAERPLPDTLLVPVDPADPELEAWLDEQGVDLRVPGAGRGGRLVELAMKNARRGRTVGDGTEALAHALGLESVSRIEGFDVSHIGGGDVVGANVCFVDGAPAKSDYRRKKLTEGNDDPGRMAQLIEWRARRAIEGRDDRSDPALLLIDGGKHQLAAARDALERVGWSIPAVALAKGPDRDSDRVITPDGPAGWDPDAAHVRLLRRVRDEAHRFAIAYHRTLREGVTSELDDVVGVGPALRTRLLRRFGSVGAIREASSAELREVEGVGEATAERIDRRI